MLMSHYIFTEKELTPKTVCILHKYMPLDQVQNKIPHITLLYNYKISIDNNSIKSHFTMGMGR